MPKTMADIVGYIAGAITISSMLPQIVKMRKSKSSDGLSKSMMVISIASSLTWTLEGILLKSTPIVIINLLILAIYIYGTYLTFIYKKKK